MMISKEIEQELREALSHLYDPDYLPSSALYELTGCEPQGGVLAVHTALVQAIEELRPSENTPSSSRIRQVYDILRNRFVSKLTLEETAERMHMSYSSTWRAQQSAVHVLARTLWERSQAQPASAEGRIPEGRDRPSRQQRSGIQAPDWRSQTRRELASLHASAPDVVADVGETLDGVLKLESVLASTYHVRVEVGFVQPDLVAAVHPSVLRQILITAMRQLAQYASGKAITVSARLEDGNVKIAMTSAVAVEERPTENALVRDIVTPGGVSVEAHLEGDHAFLWIGLPPVSKSVVLVVDDNVDMAHFYRRATEGTNYHIVHIAEGQGLLEVIEAVAPDVIVLDVMLPDIDGWELLMRLHQDPVARSIPVVVCSVVREAELALSLGAAHYLSKPVRPREFTQALDRVLHQASKEAPRAPASSATAC